MTRYTLEYRITGQRKWRALSVSAKVPFPTEECDAYRQMIANNSAPKFVRWHDVSLRLLADGIVVS